MRIRHCQVTPGGNVRGRNDFLRFLSEDLRVCPDAHQESRMVVEENDFLGSCATYRGTQTSPMGPVPAVGQVNGAGSV